MRRPKRYTLQQLFQMYAVFGVDLDSRWCDVTTTEEATTVYDLAKSEAKKRYREMCRELHPDRGGDEERMKSVTALWSVLDGLKPTFRPRPQPKAMPATPDWIKDFLRGGVMPQQDSTTEYAAQRSQKFVPDEQARQSYRSKVRRVQEIFNEDIRMRTRSPVATVVTITVDEMKDPGTPTGNT